MPSISRRQRIIAAFVERLEAIQAGAEFFTNLGARVYVNELPPFGEHDPAYALAVTTPSDTAERVGPAWICQMPLFVMVLADADKTASHGDSWKEIEHGIVDVKRAIEEVADLSFGGLIIPNAFERGEVVVSPREPGTMSYGAIIPYLVSYKEGIGAA